MSIHRAAHTAMADSARAQWTGFSSGQLSSSPLPASAVLPRLQTRATTRLANLSKAQHTLRPCWRPWYSQSLSKVMGAYLSQPVTDKDTVSGAGETVEYGVSSMQGWRRTMEDGASWRVAHLQGQAGRARSPDDTY